MAPKNGSCDSPPEVVIAIGASAGGVQELIKIVEHLLPGAPATIIIATHREPGHPNILAEIIGQRAQVRVDEPEDEECMERTTIYVGDAKDRVEVDFDEFEVTEDRSMYARIHRIDDLFFSVAKSAGENAVGVILSGMLADGVQGLKAIHDAGGRCLVQAPEEAQFRSMPENALKKVPVSYVGTTEEIASQLMEIAIGRGL